MAYICSKDPSHQSEDSDYCSICGAKIAGAPSLLGTQVSSAPATAAPVIAAPSAPGGDVTCPDCGTKRTSGARFCEVCRYDFDRKSSSPTAPPPPIAPQPVVAVAEAAPAMIPTAPATSPVPEAAVGNSALSPPAPVVNPTMAPTLQAPVPASATMPASSQTQVEAALLKWEAVVAVDPALYTDPDPDIACPADEPERVFPLDFAENLLGRRSDRKDIHPEIPVGDPGVSHRHAKLLRQPDGGFVLLDVGSTNGTKLNDVEVLPGVRTPLRDGDQIIVGCWTRITIRSHA